MYVLKSILAVILTAAIWIIYAFGSMKLAEKHRWFEEWGALFFPPVVCGILALNILIGTPLSFGLFGFLICLGLFWALGVSLRI